MTDQLPNKPSELIRVAIQDLERCEASPDFIIDMDVWCGPADPVERSLLEDKPSAKCAVCFAGAVMVQSLQAKMVEEGDDGHVPDDFPEDVRRKLQALNAFREGRVWVGCNQLGLTEHVPGMGRYDTAITPYEDDPAAFKLEMLSLAFALELVGV